MYVVKLLMIILVTFKEVSQCYKLASWRTEWETQVWIAGKATHLVPLLLLFEEYIPSRLPQV